MEVLDTKVDNALEPLRKNAAANRLFYAASEVGNHSIIWHGLTLVELVRTRNLRRCLTIAAILGVESALVNGPVKMIFRRTRPEHDGERPHKLRQPKTSSFPSGHATSAFCAAQLLSKSNPRGKLFYYLVASIVSTSRVFVKIHHASDVVAGAGFGHCFGKANKKLLK